MSKVVDLKLDLETMMGNFSPMMIVSVSGNIFAANNLCEQKLNQKPNSLENKSLPEMLESPQKTLFKSDLSERLSKRKPWRTTLKFKNSITAEATIVPVNLTREKEQHFLVRPDSFESTPEPGNRLLKEKKILEAVNRNLNEGVYRSTETGKIIYANKAMLKIFGYEDLDEIKNIHLSEVYVDPGKRQQVLDKLAKNGEVVNEEVLLKRKNKEIFWGLLGTTRSVLDDGTVVYDGVIRNITAFKELESRLREEKNKAEEAARTKEQFLSIMSHELRTPMNAVIGITDLLLRDNPQDHQIENLKTLQFSADNLLHLINDILDYSKIEAGKVEFESITFHLPETISKVFETFKQKAISKNLNYVLHLSDEVPNYVKGDPTRLSQILNNLISNALKFTFDGEVSISVHSALSPAGDHHLFFEVKDTGIGIPTAQKGNIFEMFTQANTSTNRQFGGTGLGLAITKMLVELMGGDVELESIENEGSTFKFDLYFGSANQDQKKKGKSKGESDFSELTILIVEDNLVNQMVLEKYLKMWNANVLLASSGKECLEVFEKNKTDLVLMDLQMPEVDGYEAAVKIRDHCKSNNLTAPPIIAVTASSVSEIKKKVTAVGMVDYISKPFSPKELQKKIALHTSPQKGA